MLNKKISIILATLLIGSFLNSSLSSASYEKVDNNVTQLVDDDILKDSYLLGPGDVIRLNVFGDIQFSREEITILTDGKASIPYTEKIHLQGKTLEQAERAISEALKNQLISPVLDVSLVRARPVSFSILGEVEKPGLYTWRDNNFNPQVDLVSAIQNAGGITKEANIKHIEIKRRLPGEKLNYKKAKLSLYDLILKGKMENNPLLFDGDIIKVNQADKSIKLSRDIINTNLYPQIITVYVNGEVTRPGPTKVSSKTTLSKAILAAGGALNSRASRSNIKLIRMNKDGTILSKKFKLDLSEKESDKLNPRLVDGDFIIVNRNALSRISDGLGQVMTPVSQAVNAWTLFRIIDD